MVELRTRRREIRRDGANHHEKLGLGEMNVQVNLPSSIGSYKSQCGVALHQHEVFLTQSGKSYPDFTYCSYADIVLIFLPISHFLIHNSIIIAEQKVK